jgi:hypothetical protein
MAKSSSGRGRAIVIAGSGVAATAAAIIVVRKWPRILTLLKKIDPQAMVKQAPAHIRSAASATTSAAERARRATMPAAHSLRHRVPGTRHADQPVPAGSSRS